MTYMIPRKSVYGASGSGTGAPDEFGRRYGYIPAAGASVN